MWEGYCAEYFEIIVLRHQIVGSSSKGTIHELIVVRVSSYQLHAEMRVNKSHVLSVKDKQNDVLGNGLRNLLTEYLLILVENVV